MEMAEGQNTPKLVKGIEKSILDEWGRLFKLCYQRPKGNTEIDAIVVSTGDWTDRVHTALYLWQRYAQRQGESRAPILIPAGLVSTRGWQMGRETGQQPYNAVWMGRWFKSHGVPQEKIIVEPSSRNTKEMADFSLRILKENHLRRVILTVSPYFVPRCYLTMVKSISQNEHSFVTEMYCVPSEDLPWQGYVPNEPKTRFQQIPTEIGKIHEYRLKGDIASEDEVIKYVNWLKGKR